MRLTLLASILLLALPTARAAEPASARYGLELEGFDYPYPVQRHRFQSQGQPLQMAYLDVRPQRPNGETVVLLHGKNFCAATWEATIAALREAGYRVIAPDQVGFCKSSKPERYQFSLHQLAANTHGLLRSLGIERAHVVGHSMGGMLATRYALMYPQATAQLLLVNPIGLEDWQAEGVPWISIDDNYARELKTDYASIRRYQQNSYYDGQWKPEYDRWARMLAGLYAGPGRERVAWTSALTSDMVFSQPVLYEFPRLRVPTTLLIGQRDRTVVRGDTAPAEVRARLGQYPQLGKRTAAAIPDARLVEFADLGHSPQVEAPERFNAALLEALATR
ncbi:alpha/beta fold hydrolase [Vulcaniibacterium tengchongense]|uniref:Pimeloyl-ACP methyl ester carboxylesterase n=1 Tax=Vulcaniibacterium tengchongense TaxID=1273429 RepID=A0A3N4VMF5_9GAMM|nr:alpha/beta hydrolase [Vulcaniibacterium tengchongense]RPE80979.1 pimeloyl-ACP methyl ester carboxylesterase [Vulcaniibacterium tengchongense]